MPVTELMASTGDGHYHVELDGTFSSVDVNNAVLDSKHLTDDEFTKMTGCVMSTPENPNPLQPPACKKNQVVAGTTQKDDVPAVFRRECSGYVCNGSAFCFSIGCQGCVIFDWGIIGFCINV